MCLNVFHILLYFCLIPRVFVCAFLCVFLFFVVCVVIVGVCVCSCVRVYVCVCVCEEYIRDIPKVDSLR